MKNVNIFMVHGKILVLWRDSQKTIYSRDFLKRGGPGREVLGQFADLKGGKKERVVFLRGGMVDTPMHTLNKINDSNMVLLSNSRKESFGKLST